MPLRFPSVIPGAYRQPLTIRHLLDANALSAAEQTITYRDQHRFTYSDFRRRVARLANALRALGVVEGVTVAFLDWDSHRYLEAFFAVPMMGAVLQTANVRLPPDQLRYTLDHAGAEVIVVHRDFLPLVESLRGSLPKVRATVAIMDGFEESRPDWCEGEYEALLASESAAFDFRDFDENAIATTFYTTGTTGLPKAVCFSHRQIVLHTMALAAALGTADGAGLRRDGVYMPLTPMFHVHAWGVPYVATMLGLRQVYPGRYEPDMILKLRRDHDVSFSHCVPTILQMLLEALPQDEDLAGWHLVIGGSALTRELFERATARGCELTTGYGMSETGPVVAIGRAGATSDDAIRSGVPVPLVSTRIVDEEMGALAEDDRVMGELVLRAPWLTPCYVGDEAASRDLWRGGWLHTQDIATIASNGSIQIRDRIKDVIKTGGEWICSTTIEGLIAARPDVAEVAVVGIPDAKWQERPIAAVVPTAGSRPTLGEINATLRNAVERGEIGKFALVDRLLIIEALPLTSVGKIDKKAIRAGLATDCPEAR